MSTLYQYIKWRNLLDNINNTALSLEAILQVYQNRQSLEELEELRQNELSTSDKNDVRNISYKNKTQILLNKSQEDFLIVFGFIVAFSSLYKDMWSFIHNIIFKIVEHNILSSVLTLILAVVLLYVLSIILPFVYRFIFAHKEDIEANFLGINTIDLRSKKKLGYEIEHEADHNFIDRIEDVIGYVESNIDYTYRVILSKGRRRILSTRVNPRKRSIKIKYIFDKDNTKEFFELKSIGIKRDDLKNKNLKIKFFVVYNFILKLNKKNGNKEYFHLYNNSAKVYFNIGVVGRLKKQKMLYEDEDIIRKRLYAIFLENFNVHEKERVSS